MPSPPHRLSADLVNVPFVKRRRWWRSLTWFRIVEEIAATFPSTKKKNVQYRIVSIVEKEERNGTIIIQTLYCGTETTFQRVVGLRLRISRGTSLSDTRKYLLVLDLDHLKQTCNFTQVNWSQYMGCWCWHFSCCFACSCCSFSFFTIGPEISPMEWSSVWCAASFSLIFLHLLWNVLLLRDECALPHDLHSCSVQLVNQTTVFFMSDPTTSVTHRGVQAFCARSLTPRRSFLVVVLLSNTH